MFGERYVSWRTPPHGLGQIPVRSRPSSTSRPARHRMSTSLRIEELKKKFDENPRRYFAPLANEYRKAGDLQQAISICQAHLPQQPGHMSGHIVYGQALFEARQFDQARTVFETALALDPENLIALRYLGDIAFELGDRAGARGWYTRVLETDPRNEEIAALMAAMGAEERAAAPRESDPGTTPTKEPVAEPARA
ncbi:MAG: tetratricopeptide repeat protein, partial [Gemmatimonadota bacterium]|nr:tetratricopeptide repeat protein [Gemmatimonadota bacterium]